MNGILSQTDYLFGEDYYDDEYTKIEQYLEQLSKEKEVLPELNPTQNKWFSAFSKYKNEKALSREILLAQIERIYIVRIHQKKSESKRSV